MVATAGQGWVGLLSDTGRRRGVCLGPSGGETAALLTKVLQCWLYWNSRNSPGKPSSNIFDVDSSLCTGPGEYLGFLGPMSFCFLV
ncbi:unnamed protein product [Boreogadus saida]